MTKMAELPKDDAFGVLGFLFLHGLIGAGFYPE
jgi:hypothetical protein